MLKTVCIVVFAALAAPSQVAFADQNLASHCVDVSVPRNEVVARNGKWIELTPDQWQFLRGVYAMDSESAPELPYGDKAALAQIAGNSDGLVFFIDGDKACTPMWAPPRTFEPNKGSRDRRRQPSRRWAIGGLYGRVTGLLSANGRIYVRRPAAEAPSANKHWRPAPISGRVARGGRSADGGVRGVRSHVPPNRPG
jgi:hypothetical protein